MLVMTVGSLSVNFGDVFAPGVTPAMFIVEKTSTSAIVAAGAVVAALLAETVPAGVDPATVAVDAENGFEAPSSPHALAMSAAPAATRMNRRTAIVSLRGGLPGTMRPA